MSEVDDSKRESEPSSPEVASSPDERAGEPSLKDAEGDLGELDEIDEIDIRELMRYALEAPPQAEPPDLLKGVQRRIRTRSRGKFYADGWSTARAPRSTYLVTSVLMLVLIGFVFLVLIPWGGGALPLP